MTRISIVGGTGFAGGHIAAEAAARGHEVTSWSRHEPANPVPGVTYRTGSVFDDQTLRDAVTGADVVVEALSPRGELAGRLEPIVVKLANLVQDAGSRLGVVGGAGSLLVSEDGPMMVDAGGFPDDYVAEAHEMADILKDLQNWDGPLDWFYLSPAGNFGAWMPGERTGKFRLGGDVRLLDADGNSNISGADYAIAFVDEIERPAHIRQRFSVAY